MRKGEIYWFRVANNYNPENHVQAGSRPYIVFGTTKGPAIQAIPLTTKLSKLSKIPTHALLTPQDTMLQKIKPSVVLCEQISTLPKTSIIGEVPDIVTPEKLTEIDRLLLKQLCVEGTV